MGTVAADVSHRIGAHVPIAGGLMRGAAYAERIAATAVQVFVGNPRGWALPERAPQQSAAFAQWAAEHDIPVFVHASMLVNLGSPKKDVVERSCATLRHALARGAEFSARGVVFHAGSSITTGYCQQALVQLREVLTRLLDEIPDDGPDLLVEPTAGGGCPLAARLEDVAPYLAAVDGHPRLGVCLDTCHAMAAGHNVSTFAGMSTAIDAIVTHAGEGRLRLIHANDAKDPCGSHRDRHETIGLGTIGDEPFGALFQHAAAAQVPVIVETPAATDGSGHAADVATLRALAQRAPQPQS